MWQDVSTHRVGDDVLVIYRGEIVGRLKRVPRPGRWCDYIDGERRYDNRGVAAREMVRRVLGARSDY